MTNTNDFSAFIKGYKENKEVQYVASNRFIDPETGEPIAWTLAPVSAYKNQAMRKDCTIQKPKKMDVDFDNDKYLGMLCAETIKYPNIKSATFQDEIGVKSANDLLLALLNSGEYDELAKKVMEVNGYGNTMEELLEKAKN